MSGHDRTPEILAELRFQREILSEHTEVLRAIQRDLSLLQDIQRAHGEEVGSLIRDVHLIKRGVFPGCPPGRSALTPVPKVNPTLDCAEEL